MKDKVSGKSELMIVSDDETDSCLFRVSFPFEVEFPFLPEDVEQEIRKMEKRKAIMHFINNWDGAVKIQYSFLKSQLYFCNVDKKKPLVFFDGVCNFCNYWVNFAIKRDKKGKLMFSPFQGETAKEKLTQFNFNQEALNSVILFDKGKIFTQSSAAIRICRYLDSGWKLLYGLIIIPKFIRDFFYNIIARNRYKWFGKKEECMVPTPELKERFLK